MEDLAKRADLSWLKDLTEDPESFRCQPNRTSREVKSGHYVKVKPNPLPEPRLVIFSTAMAAELGLSEEACTSQDFLRFFSGDTEVLSGFDSWATPYALAIMGQPRTDNCPFKNGNGYGDGRAISVGEVLAPGGQRWEMQLKGGGQTPFCRRADGRAVLRSSVREFLASEAMYHLGISTTRALSLIVSMQETVQRPWYSGRQDAGMPDLDDPRLAAAPAAMRQMLLRMLQQQSGEPDVLITEPCAITCRVAPSFTRIGHLDLFARRAIKSTATPEQVLEHEMMVKHAIEREYADVLPGRDVPLAERALAVFDIAAERIAAMTTNWLRVGFCQGNFNCDNCLFAGRTMDYGPFGFMDKFDPGFAKWVGSGDHFAFMNQPAAGLANLGTLATALEPLLTGDERRELRRKREAAEQVFRDAERDMWCLKLGFESGTAEVAAHAAALLRLMERSQADYTITFRELASVPATLGESSIDGARPAVLMAPLRNAFYQELSPQLEEQWVAWLRGWMRLLESQAVFEGVGDRMKAVNPKYILREYMLVDAYNAARQENYGLVHELYQLVRNPYAEQPEMEPKYYRRAPDAALNTSGTSVMT